MQSSETGLSGDVWTDALTTSSEMIESAGSLRETASQWTSHSLPANADILPTPTQPSVARLASHSGESATPSLVKCTPVNCVSDAVFSLMINNIDTVRNCQKEFAFELPSVILARHSEHFFN